MKNQPLSTANLTTFGLLRHGQTEWNLQKKIQGSCDSPLTQKGKEQIAEWSLLLKNYNWRRIIASDQQRVRETVAILNRELAVPVDFDARLREQDWGDWEGLTIPYIKTHFGKDLERRVQKGWHFAAPGGETRMAVKARAMAALSETAAKGNGEHILVVCHQGVIKSILYSIARKQFMPGDEKMLKANRFHLIGFKQQQLSLLQLNIERQA